MRSSPSLPHPGHMTLHGSQLEEGCYFLSLTHPGVQHSTSTKQLHKQLLDA